jgi:DNA-binding LacI/PurR family transcriptional regulator/AraC-like DNA-binding protein/signal transduction histidine kinase
MGYVRSRPLRVALLLASIHTGSSESLWTSIADMAEASGNALFVFPGGRLDAPGEFEYLRNSIYRLANSATVDALVSWGSSLVGTVDGKRAIEFHRNYASLPMVTIALPIEGADMVSFDAYRGMKALVSHCIEIHGATRIAFIRGPENHVSAEQRFQAYRDALAEAGIPILEELISSPFPWHRGESALRELLDDRHLRPKKDFSMIGCASDLLMLNAANMLEKRGYRIPEEVGIVGFNDSAESRFLSVPGTTVRVPFGDLGRVAYQTLIQRLSGAPAKQEVMLPAQPVIRCSCGCSFVEQWQDNGCRIFGREQLRDWMVRRFSMDQELQLTYLDPLVEALYRGPCDNMKSLLSMAGKVLERYFLNEPDSSAFQRTMEALSHVEDLDSTYLSQVVHRCRNLALETQSRIANHQSYRNIQRAAMLDAFKCDLLRAWNRTSIVTIMKQHLRNLGVRQSFLIMNEGEDLFRFVGGFTGEESIEGTGELFPTHRILPQRLEATIGAGVHLVLPLFIENQVLGHVVFTITDRDALKFEELRSSISSALKGVLLFEEMAKAKEIAQKAEQAEMEFFASMGDSLKEPLRAFVARVEDLGTRIPPSLFSDVARLETDIKEHLHHIGLLFDQTLAQVGALELDRILVSPDRILQSVCDDVKLPFSIPEAIPLVLADPKRLRQILSLIIASCAKASLEVTLSVEPSLDGLHIMFTNVPEDIPPLVESLVLLHGGSYVMDGGVLMLRIPWPRLNEHPVAKEPVPSGTLLVLSKGEPRGDVERFALSHDLEIKNLAVEDILQGTGEGKGGSILVFDTEGADVTHYLAMVKLLRCEAFLHLHVMVYGTVLEGGKSVGSAIGRHLGSLQKAPVLVWGDAARLAMCRELLTEVVAVTDSEHLAEVVAEVSPGCIVMHDPDMGTIAAIREEEGCGSIPLVVILNEFPDEAELERLGRYSRLILCHSLVCSDGGFCERVREIASGGDVLPSYTGILVKRAQSYIVEHANGPIARWKMAEAVNTSEDYLTRIFKRELGMSPWEYLNRFRIEQSVCLLKETQLPLSEIAIRCGFQDQAYFCRVFKKLKGTTPTTVRSG